MPPSPAARSGRHHVGGDLAIRRGDLLEVHATREMSEWEVRKYGANGIVFDGTIWVTVAVEPGGSRGVVYRLEPWDRAKHDSVPKKILYDADYVEARERSDQGVRIGRWLAVPVGLAAPILGLLPARATLWFEEALGIDSVTVTRASAYAPAAVGAPLFVLVSVLGFASMMVALRYGPIALFSFVGVLWRLMVVIAVIGVDFLVRGKALKGERVTLGFYEWAVIAVWRLGRRIRGAGR